MDKMYETPVAYPVEPKDMEEEKVEEKEEYKINLSEPVDFCPCGSVQFTTTIELAKIINDIFVQTFDDFVGSMINVRQEMVNGQVYMVIAPELYFKVLDNRTYKRSSLTAFEPIAMNPKDDLVRRVQRVSQMSMSSTLKITMSDAGKTVLEDFIVMPKSYNRDKYDWNNTYKVITNDNETFIRVMNLDMNKFIKKIYGEYDRKNHSELTYQITPIECRRSGYGNIPDNWKLAIMQLNVNNTMRSAELTGTIMPNIGPSSMPRMVMATKKD